MSQGKTQVSEEAEFYGSDVFIAFTGAIHLTEHCMCVRSIRNNSRYCKCILECLKVRNIDVEMSNTTCSTPGIIWIQFILVPKFKHTTSYILMSNLRAVFIFVTI